jgi:hypothetical protein
MTQGASLNSALIDGFHLSFVVAGACAGVGLVAAQVLLRPRAGATHNNHSVVEPEPESWRRVMWN